jgi:hypothetical protein
MKRVENITEVFVANVTEEAGYKKETTVKCVDLFQYIEYNWM